MLLAHQMMFRGGGGRGPNDPFYCPHPALQGPPFGDGAVPQPDGDAVAEDVLDGSSVEGCEDERAFLVFRLQDRLPATCTPGISHC